MPSNRYLLLAGTESYTKGGLARLRAVPNSLASLAKAFRLLEYSPQVPTEQRPADFWLNPQQDPFGKWVHEWSKQRGAEDIVVLYYVGHGLVEDGPQGRQTFYLAAADTDLEEQAVSGITADELGQWLLKDTTPTRILLIIESCNGATGIEQFITSAVGNKTGRGRTVCAITAVTPAGTVPQSLLGAGMTKVLSHRHAGGRAIDRLPYTQFVSCLQAQCNILAKRYGDEYVYTIVPFLFGQHCDDFFPNPNYSPHVVPGDELAKQEQLLALPADWLAKARGTDDEIGTGSYFSGRAAALERIGFWLRNPFQGDRVFWVTGSPGCGKSAVLSRAYLSQDGISATHNGDNHLRLPKNALQVALLARRKSLDDILKQIGKAAGVSEGSPHQVRAALVNRREVFVALIDALDEAIDPLDLRDGLLDLVRSAPALRLLLGTRTHVLDRGYEPATVVDLDSAEYFDITDVSKYVHKILVAEGHPTLQTPYQQEPKRSQEIATAIAEAAKPSFLLARLTAENLRRRAKVLDSRGVKHLPQTVEEAFGGYFDYWEQDGDRLRGLLAPLSFAAGKGLPFENIWAVAATGLSMNAGTAYAAEDVEWVLERAYDYVVEDVEETKGLHSVYRLFHEKLTEYLKDWAKSQNPDAERDFLSALIRTVPGTR